MFTGLVEAVGTVAAAEDVGDGRLITVRAPEVVGDMEIGDSVAVDGACLTVVGLADGAFRTEAIATTLSRTVAGRYREGSRVNLERALALGDRLGGHLVQGHVDEVAETVRMEAVGEHHLLEVRLSAETLRGTVLHGSITLNGVSLTVNALPGDGVCQVALIPHTLEATNLADLEPGDPVNVEADLIGKYVGRWVAPHLGVEPPPDPTSQDPPS